MKTRWAFVHKHDILTHKNNMLFLEVKRPPLLWWHMDGNPLKNFLRCIPLWLKHLWIFPRNLWLSSENLGNLREFSENAWNDCLAFGQMLENLRKSSENHQKKASPSQLDISLVCCAHSWYIKLNTWIEIPYLHATMYYTPCTPLEVNQNSISVMIWICLMGHNLMT